MKTYTLKKYFYPFLIIFALGCKGDSELAMERGIYYYDVENWEQATLEFNYVINNLPSQTEKLTNNQIELKSLAHRNLALSYAQQKWYKDAFEEARKAFDLIPSAKNRTVMELIQNQIPTESIKTVKQKTTTP